MDQTLGFIIIGISIIGGILLLTGHGEFLMGGGNSDERKKMYDQKKMEKASGVAFLIIGAATIADLFTKTMAAKIAYLIFIVVVFALLIVYLRKKCMK